MADTALQGLVERIGADHVVRRLGLEAAHEKQLIGQGTLVFNVENWRLAPWVVTTALKLVGLHGRARRNADRVEVRRNLVMSPRLPGYPNRPSRGSSTTPTPFARKLSTRFSRP